MINTNALVGTTSSVIAQADKTITYKIVLITNDSPNVVYLAVNDTAVMNSGIRLNANGGAVAIDATHYLDIKGLYISGISSVNNSNVCISILQ